jgi:hypothetical protein
MNTKTLYLLSIIILIFESPAYAYIGPGAGLGAIFSFFGIVLSVILIIIIFLISPIIKLYKKLKNKRK